MLFMVSLFRLVKYWLYGCFMLNVLFDLKCYCLDHRTMDDSKGIKKLVGFFLEMLLWICAWLFNGFRSPPTDSSYQQVSTKKFNVWKTTFKSKEDIFKWLLMDFGLINSLAMFMSMMNNILHRFTNYFVVIYLDDISIISKT